MWKVISFFLKIRLYWCKMLHDYRCMLVLFDFGLEKNWFYYENWIILIIFEHFEIKFIMIAEAVA